MYNGSFFCFFSFILHTSWFSFSRKRKNMHKQKRPAHLLSDLERGHFLLALYFAPTVWYNAVNQDGIPDRLDAQGIFKYGSNLLQRRFIWHSRHMPEYGVDTSKHTWICKRGNFYGSHSTGGRRLRDDEPQRELLCATVQGLNIRVTPCRYTPATSHQYPV